MMAGEGPSIIEEELWMGGGLSTIYRWEGTIYN
jgi:hypothetical protein